jgi:hypothetical protein
MERPPVRLGAGEAGVVRLAVNELGDRQRGVVPCIAKDKEPMTASNSLFQQRRYLRCACGPRA